MVHIPPISLLPLTCLVGTVHLIISPGGCYTCIHDINYTVLIHITSPLSLGCGHNALDSLLQLFWSLFLVSCCVIFAFFCTLYMIIPSYLHIVLTIILFCLNLFITHYISFTVCIYCVLYSSLNFILRSCLINIPVHNIHFIPHLSFIHSLNFILTRQSLWTSCLVCQLLYFIPHDFFFFFFIRSTSFFLITTLYSSSKHLISLTIIYNSFIVYVIKLHS